ncbi:MAG: hypothetical protein ACYC9S_08445 [Leptospirales bacterium]
MNTVRKKHPESGKGDLRENKILNSKIQTTKKRYNGFRNRERSPMAV